MGLRISRTVGRRLAAVVLAGVFATLTPALPASAQEKDAPAPAADPVKLKPVPDAAGQAASLKLLKELYKPYPPGTTEARIATARKLLTQAHKDADDPVAQYVLFHEAAELSVAANDTTTAFGAIDESAAIFAIDAFQEKLAILKRIKPAQLRGEAAASAADGAEGLGWQAIRKGDYAEAARIATLASTFAHTSGDMKLAGGAQALAAEARRAQQELDHEKLAEKKLQTDPDDAQSNFVTGRYLCFWRGEWEAGLPRLAKGSDAGLKAIAEKDLLKPAEADAKFALADQWRDLAAKEAGTVRMRERQRAAYWYEQALPDLAALKKSLAEQRLDEMHRSEGSEPLAGSREATLTRLLNDRRQWTVKSGKWPTDAKGLRGEGESRIDFNNPLPPTIVFSFHINVVSGMRPRMRFEGTNMTFGNEGSKKSLFPFGTNVTAGGGYDYENDQPHLLRFKLAGDHFTIEIDGKMSAEGTYKAPESIHLSFDGGDGFSPGTTEFWGFNVESMGKMPVK